MSPGLTTGKQQYPEEHVPVRQSVMLPLAISAAASRVYFEALPHMPPDVVPVSGVVPESCVVPVSGPGDPESPPEVASAVEPASPPEDDASVPGDASAELPEELPPESGCAALPELEELES
jgi:hypothetical protein